MLGWRATGWIRTRSANSCVDPPTGDRSARAGVPPIGPDVSRPDSGLLEPPPAARALPLRRLEMATGLAVGEDEPVFGGPDGGGPADPRAALRARVREALLRRPCCVSFSGGRDSSAVLAVATAVARSEGLPDPVPLTLRFTGIASTDEAYWQELVINHLGLREWEVIAVGEELDLLGGIARRALVGLGLMWPPNAYIHVPMLERAAGGCVMTGYDGDGLLGGWRWRRAQGVIGGRLRPESRDLPRVALALAPPWARRPLMRPPLLGVVPWLRPGARRELAGAMRGHAASEPRRWDRRIAYYARHRYLRLAVHSLDLLGARRGVELVHPLLDPGFLGALAGAGGAGGLGDRTQALRALFADLLPEPVLSRRAKAEFGAGIWRREARAFAAGWDGCGLDMELIDPAPLREAWRAPSPLFGSSTLLQAAWLAAQAK